MIYEHEKKAVVHVLGCKVNQAEAAAMASMLRRQGYIVDNSAKEPDLVLVNTCCVTSRAEGKSRRLVNRLAEKYPSAKVVVTGCLAEVNPASIQGSSERVVTLGTYEKDRFSIFLNQAVGGLGRVLRSGASGCSTFEDQGCLGIPERGRAFLKVQDGCSQGCSYCIVPIARGPSRSLAPDAVCSYARRLEEEGFAEIVLTGIHLGHYGRDLTPRLGLEDLLESLLGACAVVRFRLSSVEPQEITPRLIELAASHQQVCRHFHIPLQSGDDEILHRMGRPYNASDVRELLKRIISAVPDACVGLDVMVGFPGETEARFENTLGLVEESGAAYLHVFPFSARPGTVAASLRQRVSDETARARVERLRELSTAMRERFYKRFLGRTLFAVAETRPDPDSGMVSARTDNYIPVTVRVPEELRGGNSFSVTLVRIEQGEVEAEIFRDSTILPS